ncbi:unnamed protein product, partial [Ectocarpus fasciculatus]
HPCPSIRNRQGSSRKRRECYRTDHSGVRASRCCRERGSSSLRRGEAADGSSFRCLPPRYRCHQWCRRCHHCYRRAPRLDCCTHVARRAGAGGYRAAVKTEEWTFGRTGERNPAERMKGGRTIHYRRSA